MSPPTVAHAYSSKTTGATSLTTTVSASGGGNLFAAAVQVYSATPVTGLAVSGAFLGTDTWVQVYSQKVIPGTWVDAVWIDPGASAGKTSLRVNVSGANSTTQLNVLIWEIAGWVPGYPVDVLVAQAAVGGSFSLVSPASSQTDTLWLGVCAAHASSAPSMTGPGSPWVSNGLAAVANSVGPDFTALAGFTDPVTGSTAPVTFAGSTSPAASPSVLLVAVPGVLLPSGRSQSFSDPAAGAPGQGGVWGVPPGTTSVSVAGTGGGGGGGGGGAAGGNNAGGGGAGGEYAADTLPVTAGTLAQFATGAAGGGGAAASGGNAGPGTAAANTTFPGFVAHGGNGGGGGTTSAGGTGGAAATGSGNTVHHNGGGGAPGTTSNAGGGGGSSAGTGAAGNAGSGIAGGSAPSGGGPGGGGGNSSVNPTAPASGPGGGGGGGGHALIGGQAGQAGWSGTLTLSYTILQAPPRLVVPVPVAAVTRAAAW